MDTTLTKPQRRRSASRGRRSSIFVPVESETSETVQVSVPHDMAAPNIIDNSVIDKRVELRSLIDSLKEHIATCIKEKEFMYQKYIVYKDYINEKKDSPRDAIERSSNNTNKKEGGDVRPRYFLNGVTKRFLELDDCAEEKDELHLLKRKVEFERRKINIMNDAIDTFSAKLLSESNDHESTDVQDHKEQYLLVESMQKKMVRAQALNELLINLNL